MYEEHCRGFNFVGLAIQRDIKLLFRQNIVIGQTNLPFGKICINLPRRTPQAICNLTVPTPGPCPRRAVLCALRAVGLKGRTVEIRKSGSRYYGKTNRGEYVSEKESVQKGYRPANG